LAEEALEDAVGRLKVVAALRLTEEETEDEDAGDRGMQGEAGGRGGAEVRERQLWYDYKDASQDDLSPGATG
jgi:hypothetical protein